MFSKRDWLLLVVAAGFIVLGVWMDLEIPRYLHRITLLVIEPGGTMGQVWVQGGYMLAFAFGSMATAFIIAWIGALVSSNHAQILRAKLFSKVGEFSAAELKKFSVPSLITRGTNDVTQVRTFTAMAVQMLVRAPVMAVWAILRISGTSWQLSLVAFIAVALLMIVLTFIIIIALPRFNRIQKLTDKMNQVTRENLTGMRVVRAYNAQGFEQEKFEGVNKKLYRDNLVVNRCMGVFWPFISLLMSTLVVAIYWVGSSIIGGHPNPSVFIADMMVFSQYSGQVIFAFMIMVMVLVFFPRTAVSARRINEVLRTEVSIVSPTGNNAVGLDLVDVPANKFLSFENVSFSYPGAQKPVLRDISLTIEKGQTVAFIGGTGSGKSTLVNLVPRIYDTTQGQITLGETCIRDMTLDELNSAVGYIPQTATLFTGTIRDNIALGDVLDKGEIVTPSDEDVKEALKMAQAWKFVEKLGTEETSWLDAPVSQGGKNFSGGQKQRLAIARILARKPKILIFDDTFSALDYKTDTALRSALKKARAKQSAADAQTTLIVAQRIGTIRDCDKIFVLDKGRIVGSGTHEELMKNCDVYIEIAKSQLSKEELGVA